MTTFAVCEFIARLYWLQLSCREQSHQQLADNFDALQSRHDHLAEKDAEKDRTLQSIQGELLGCRNKLETSAFRNKVVCTLPGTVE